MTQIQNGEKLNVISKAAGKATVKNKHLMNVVILEMFNI